MAAGLGTRLRPFTGLIPKPFLPLMGVPVAQYGIDLLVQAGVNKIVANVHHLPERARFGFRALDLSGGRAGARLEISDESRLLLGSAGGVYKARPLLGDGAFFLMNSDVLCDVDLKQLALRHRQLRRDFGVWLTLAVFPSGPGGGKYREIKLDYSRGLIRGLGELVPQRPFFAGVAMLEPEALKFVPKEGPSEFVPTILMPAIKEGKAGAYLASGLWYDIGSPALWLQTHLSLMEEMEKARLPIAWRHRIESCSSRVAPGVWVSKEANRPATFGPRAVLYGDFSQSHPLLFDGIGYRGLWVGVSGDGFCPATGPGAG
jgi:NDP-sugar pyrophosphorylase family protein